MTRLTVSHAKFFFFEARGPSKLPAFYAPGSSSPALKRFQVRCSRSRQFDAAPLGFLAKTYLLPRLNDQPEAVGQTVAGPAVELDANDLGTFRMNIEGVEKKLREARFFLDKMIEHERMAFDKKEPFDFYLSAFLGAGRTVDYRLRHVQKAIYPIWRDGWDATLTQAQQDLIKFMIDDRNVEIHASGSTRVVKTEARELGSGSHSLASGTIEVFGPPGTFPLATIQTPGYYFTIEGIEEKVTKACEQYLALLHQMVVKLKADYP
jgi:hypothetical protein